MTAEQYQWVTIGVAFTGLVMTAVMHAYKLRRDVAQDIGQVKKDTDKAILDAKLEMKNEIIAANITERRAVKLELERLEGEILSTREIMLGHIEYSKQNHPTNKTVFPVLARIERKLEKMDEKEDQQKDAEIRDLKRKLEESKK